MQLNSVSPSARALWRVQACLVTAVLFVGAGFAVYPLAALDPRWLWAPPLVLVLGLSLAWLWPAAYYRRLRYGMDATGIAIERGVLWRQRSLLPRIRIQHSDVFQGPLQRRFDLGTLKLYTAGSRFTCIELPGLPYAQALALRDELLREGHGDAV